MAPENPTFSWISRADLWISHSPRWGLSSFTLTDSNITFPFPHPGAQWCNPILHFKFQGKQISEPFEIVSDKNEGHGDGEEGSVDILCLPSSPFSLLCATSGGLWCFLGETWPWGSWTQVTFANYPKEEVVQMNRLVEIPSVHQRNRIVLRPKPNVRMGSFHHSRQNSGTNPALGFPDHSLEGSRQQNRVERACTWGQSLGCKFDSVTCSPCDIRQAT